MSGWKLLELQFVIAAVEGMFQIFVGKDVKDVLGVVERPRLIILIVVNVDVEQVQMLGIYAVTDIKLREIITVTNTPKRNVKSENLQD